MIITFTIWKQDWLLIYQKYYHSFCPIIVSPPHHTILRAKCSLVKLLSCIGYAQSHFIGFFISSRWRYQMYCSSKWKRQRKVIYIAEARIRSSSSTARRSPHSSLFIGQHLALKLDIWKKFKWIWRFIYSVPCAKQKASIDNREFQCTTWKATQLFTFLSSYSEILRFIFFFQC